MFKERNPEIEMGEKNEKKEIRLSEIEELRRPMEKILRGIMPHIEAGDYGMIVGDDASGRIPALIFDKILKGLYKRNGLSSPETIFFAGSRHASNGAVVDNKTHSIADIFKRKIKENANKGQQVRVLVVTDTITTGSSLKPICDALKENNIEFDIATMGFTGNDTGKEFEDL